MFWLFNQSILDLSVKFTELEVRIYNIKLHDDETSLYTISKILLIIQYQLNFNDSPKKIDILNFHSLLYYSLLIILLFPTSLNISLAKISFI